jgi:hypothetical protein
MSNANNARRPNETEAEAVRRLAGLTPPRDASAMRSHNRPQRSAVRRPLGLAPVPGDEADERDDGEPDTRGAIAAREVVDRAIGGMSPAARAKTATVEDGFRIAEMAVAVSLEGDDELFQHIKALRTEVAELKAKVEKLTTSSAPKPAARARRA